MPVRFGCWREGMSVENTDGTTIRWGKAEKWIAAGVSSLITVLIGILIGVLTNFGSSVNSRLDKQNDTLQSVKTEQAVQSGQIGTLTTQLADVPRLTRDMAEVKVRVERLEQDARDTNRR